MLVVGAVLLGTGVAVSAKGAPSSQQVSPLKKKTTTTTTSTTVVSSTTTQPCSPAPTTFTNGAFSLTLTPGTCLVDGSVVSVTGSGFSPNSLSTLLQCSGDPAQPTVNFLANDIPISCSNPLSSKQGPGLKSTSSKGTYGPFNFTVEEGFTGPPCGPSSCTGTAATDSSGGDPFADAAKYPCPPTAAEGASVACQIIFGDASTPAESVTADLSFNTALPPPATTIPTAQPTTPTTPGATVAPAAKPGGSTKTSSSSLAFTGSGPGLWWLAFVGMLLMALGVLALVLVDQPRRLLRVATGRVNRSKERSS
jgi:hypothetical protein